MCVYVCVCLYVCVELFAPAFTGLSLSFPSCRISPRCTLHDDMELQHLAQHATASSKACVPPTPASPLLTPTCRERKPASSLLTDPLHICGAHVSRLHVESSVRLLWSRHAARTQRRRWAALMEEWAAEAAGAC